jgi:hypothetical protein
VTRPPAEFQRDRAAESGLVVAKAAVELGILQRERAGVLYHEYCEYLQRGVEGSFPQLLLARGVIDQEGLERLNACFDDAPSGEGTAVEMTPPKLRDEEATGEFSRIHVAPPPLSGRDSSAIQRFEATMDGAALPSLEIGIGAGLGLSGSAVDALSGAAGARAREAKSAPAPRDLGSGELELMGVSWAEDSAPPAEEAVPGVGDTLGGYTLTEQVGHGAMGVIFKATRPGRGAPYALKLVRVDGGERGRTRRERFGREVQILAQLDHPNVVRFHEGGRAETYAWYAMDYVEGRDLDEVIEDEELDLPARLRLFVQVCQGVAHAHAHGVIHRDLKPGNVRVDAGGRAFVLDFGLGKRLQADDAGASKGVEITTSTTTIGTPLYMSPEHLLDPRGIDARADVFSLGVLLYKLTTRQQPFRGENSTQVTSQVLRGEVAPPSQVRPELPRELDAICAAALAKKPAERTQTVVELEAAVARLLSPEPPPGGWVMRNAHGLAVGFLVGAGLATLVLGAVIVHLMRRLQG